MFRDPLLKVFRRLARDWDGPQGAGCPRISTSPLGVMVTVPSGPRVPEAGFLGRPVAGAVPSRESVQACACDAPQSGMPCGLSLAPVTSRWEPRLVLQMPRSGSVRGSLVTQCRRHATSGSDFASGHHRNIHVVRVSRADC